MLIILACFILSIVAALGLLLPPIIAAKEGGRVEDTARDEMPERAFGVLLICASIWGFGLGWLHLGGYGLACGIMLPFGLLGLKHFSIFRKDDQV